LPRSRASSTRTRRNRPARRAGFRPQRPAIDAVAVGLRHRNARHRGKVLDRWREIDAVKKPHERDHVAADVAVPAMKDLFFRVD
jgi:hypothetical protein